MSSAKKLNSESQFASVLEKGFQGKVTVWDHSQILSPLDASKDVVVVQNLENERLVDLVLEKKARHLVQEQGLVDIDRELNFSALMATHPERFFQHPLETIFQPTYSAQPCTTIVAQQSWNFSRSDEKRKILTELRFFTSKQCRLESVVDDVTLVGDELITNAIFNAPFVDKENSTSGVERHQNIVQMAPGFTGQFFAGVDDKRIVIGCRDPYGRLNIHRLFQRIKDCYSTGVAQNINMGRGGAGIGSFLVFNHASEYYAAVQADKMTVICCSFPLKMSGRKRLEIKKNVHLYMSEEK